MRRFAALLEQLVFSPRRNAKLAYLSDWLSQTSGDSRGYGVAVITGDLSLPHVKGKMIRDLAASCCDADLFALSYDFVGDLAETVSLLWPDKPTSQIDDFDLGTIITTLLDANRKESETAMRHYLDAMDQRQRWALLKVATGGLRVGVSARLMRLAIAQSFDKKIEDIEEIWPLLSPPFDDLFHWLEGKADRPQADGRAVFRPLMLAHPLDEGDLDNYPIADCQIEWKWDGARVQLVSASDGVRLFSRSGDDISQAFPEMVSNASWQGTLDGELLAGRPDDIGSFNDLQQRLNRKKPSKKMQEEQPVFMRCYDLLIDGEDDIRMLPLQERRQKLEIFISHLQHARLDISEILSPTSWQDVAAFRQKGRENPLIEGVMIKQKNSPYLSGRVKGQWLKWKRDPLQADLVVLYAQRGHGKRSSLYSDFTFGAWLDDGNGRHLVPVAKAYSGFTDEELRRLDKFVRSHTVNKFGPVREVEPRLVVEVAFDSIHTSRRHKSGVAMRFPRFHAIRWDKDAEEADNVANLLKLIP